MYNSHSISLSTPYERPVISTQKKKKKLPSKLSLMLRALSIPTLLPQPRPNPPKHQRRRRKKHGNAPQKRHGPVDAEARIQRPRGHDHAPRNKIPQHADA